MSTVTLMRPSSVGFLKAQTLSRAPCGEARHWCLSQSVSCCHQLASLYYTVSLMLTLASQQSPPSHAFSSLQTQAPSKAVLPGILLPRVLPRTLRSHPPSSHPWAHRGASCRGSWSPHRWHQRDLGACKKCTFPGLAGNTKSDSLGWSPAIYSNTGPHT